MTPPTLTELRQIYAARPAGRAVASRSAVLALFTQIDGHLGVILERRPDGDSRFSGHLSFPGGGLEDHDAGPLDAALRETWEEIGVEPAAIEVLGHLADSRDPYGRGVSSFVGYADWQEIAGKPTSPAEVAEVMVVPVLDLLEPGNRERMPADMYRATSHEMRQVVGDDRIVHYWELERGRSDAVLWGFTAGLLSRLLRRTWQWDAKGAIRHLSDWRDLGPRAPLSHGPSRSD